MKYCINYQASENLALDILKLCVTNNKNMVLLLVSNPSHLKYSNFFKFIASKHSDSILCFGLEKEITYANLLSACTKIRLLYPDKLLGIIHFSHGGISTKSQVELRKDIGICVNGGYKKIADFGIIGFALGTFHNKYLLETEKNIYIFDICKFVLDGITFCGEIFNKIIGDNFKKVAKETWAT